MSNTKLPEGVSPDEVRRLCLQRLAERESAAIRANLLGLGLVLLLLRDSVPTVVLGLFAGIRLLTLAYIFWVNRRILRALPSALNFSKLERQLIMGLSLGGMAWGLLAWLLPNPQTWGLTDTVALLVLTIVSALSLIVTAHIGQGMLLYNLGLWALALSRFTSTDLQQTWPLALACVTMVAVLAIFGRQLNRQAVQGVVSELHNQKLAEDLALANARLQEALDQAVAMATRDPLTQALNRRAFLERAQIEAAAMQREGHSASILMLDLDHFKAVNDRHGHGAGDAVLQQAASAIQSCLREVDALARWGGEEFLVLLPRTELSGALQVAERIRRALEAHQHPQWPPGLILTASMGIAPWPPALKLDLAITQADKALFRAKGMGRNRIDIWP